MRALQSLFKHVEHDFVCGFGLSVRLRVSGCGKGEFYAPVLAELLEFVARELGSILGDDLVGDPEASDYVGPQEFANLEVCYSAECFCFDPFGEVVSEYQKEDLLPQRRREFPYYVHCHFLKGHSKLMDLRFSGGSLETGAFL